MRYGRSLTVQPDCLKGLVVGGSNLLENYLKALYNDLYKDVIILLNFVYFDGNHMAKSFRIFSSIMTVGPGVLARGGDY